MQLLGIGESPPLSKVISINFNACLNLLSLYFSFCLNTEKVALMVDSGHTPIAIHGSLLLLPRIEGVPVPTRNQIANFASYHKKGGNVVAKMTVGDMAQWTKRNLFVGSWDDILMMDPNAVIVLSKHEFEIVGPDGVTITDVGFTATTPRLMKVLKTAVEAHAIYGLATSSDNTWGHSIEGWALGTFNVASVKDCDDGTSINQSRQLLLQVSFH